MLRRFSESTLPSQKQPKSSRSLFQTKEEQSGGDRTQALSKRDGEKFKNLSLAFKNIERVPDAIMKRYAMNVRTLDLSYNNFTYPLNSEGSND